MSSNADDKPHILCVSWDRSLAETRELLLKQSGYTVTSALREKESFEKCRTKADLLLLGHSVPREEKQKILERFRKFNTSPALSLLSPGQSKLPDVEYAVEYMDPPKLLSTIQQIIPYREI